MRGIELAKEALASEKGLREVLEERFEPLPWIELEVILEQIRSLNRSIGRLEEVIEEAGKKLPGYLNPTSISGIESLGGSILLSLIGNFEDFAQEGKLAAYFGIVPRVQNSNETEHSRISMETRNMAQAVTGSIGDDRGPVSALARDAGELHIL